MWVKIYILLNIFANNDNISLSSLRRDSSNSSSQPNTKPFIYLGSFQFTDLKTPSILLSQKEKGRKECISPRG